MEKMHELAQHIEYLLLRKECVILPGVGAFIATQCSARINEVDGEILPPVREITFNPEVTADDGTLAHSLARANSKGFEEGRDMVRRHVERLLQEMENGGKAPVGNLGVLYRKDSGKVCFMPRATRDRLAQLSGACKVSYIPQTIREKETATIKSQASRNYYVIRIPKKLAHGAAAAVVMVILCLSIALPTVKDNTHLNRASIVPVESIRKENAPKKVPAVQESTPITADTPLANEYEGDAMSAAMNSAERRHYLIIGTFATRKGAEVYCRQNSKLGEEWEICPGKSGIWRVAYAKGSKGELQEKMNSREFRDRFSGAWIWTSK